MESMVDRLIKIENGFEGIIEDAEKFEVKHNQAAGKRLRKSLMNIIKEFNLMRREVITLRHKMESGEL